MGLQAELTLSPKIAKNISTINNMVQSSQFFKFSINSINSSSPTFLLSIASIIFSVSSPV
nr:MAG TPA: hypothetical protein [Caudoviricetes sp.]